MDYSPTETAILLKDKRVGPIKAPCGTPSDIKKLRKKLIQFNQIFLQDSLRTITVIFFSETFISQKLSSRQELIK